MSPDDNAAQAAEDKQPVNPPADTTENTEVPTEPTAPPEENNKSQPETPAPKIAEDNSPYDLDLDLLQPQKRKVKLNDKIYEVNPPKVKDVANLARLAGKLQNATPGNMEAEVNQMLEVFQSIMPDLKTDGVDLTLEQMMALFGFVNQMISPDENSALKAMGIEPTTEKKVPAV